ncbi:MAG: hypothetical protein KAW12_29445 [Candidatus Aminicenantes bacterium]|nr:hypothetical protein [Candidatus Aminicenantes bacterium]
MSENEKQKLESFPLEEYINRKRFGSKFWVKFTVFASILLLAFIFKINVLDKSIAPEELKSAVEIFDISSHWIETEKIDETDFKGILLVPEISFRVRNKGKKELKHMLMLGVFRLLNASRPMGEGYKMLFSQPLVPGKESDKIVLASPFGYKATSKKAFEKNSRSWRSSQVEIYVKSRNSGMLFIQEFYINRKIEGLAAEVKVI